MTFYGVCVLAVVFGLLLAAFDLALFVAGSTLRARVERVAVERRTQTILFLRYLPVLLATATLLFVFVPAWVRFEPAETGEGASILLVAAALLALLPSIFGGHRALRVLRNTHDRLRRWTLDAIGSRSARGFEVLEVRRLEMGLCVGGYLRPAIYASRQVIDLLEPDELNAALAHETSHARAKDPLRILAMGACPDFLNLFGLDGAWRRQFARTCELAADADASRGNPHVALDLASALVKVARLREVKSPVPLTDLAVAGVSESAADLEFRVRTLAGVDSGHGRAAERPLVPRLLVAMAAVLAAGGYLVGSRVHDVTEYVGRFLAP
jgi:Zn-dependent protease with chaperone function